VIAYFDTSAVIPLLIAEGGSEEAGRLWDDAVRVVSASVTLAEGRAALAQAARLGRLSARDFDDAKRQFTMLAEQIDFVETTRAILTAAGEVAERHQLRAYDAVHLAAALRVADDDLVVVAGDRDLLQAARSAGRAIAPIGGTPRQGFEERRSR